MHNLQMVQLQSTGCPGLDAAHVQHRAAGAGRGYLKSGVRFQSIPLSKLSMQYLE